MVRRSSCGPSACWTLARTSSLVTSPYGLCMRCVVSCGRTSFPWLVFLFGALLWGSMIHKHTGRWIWQGSASVVSWNREILLSFQTGFNLVNAADVCAILESMKRMNMAVNVWWLCWRQWLMQWWIFLVYLFVVLPCNCGQTVPVDSTEESILLCKSRYPKKLQAMEIRCHHKTRISYKDHVTNEEVHAKIQQTIGPHQDLLTIVKKRKLQWYGHVSCSSGLAKTILQDTVKGERRQGRQRKRWEDNIRKWTGLEFAKFQRAAENREKWHELPCW